MTIVQALIIILFRHHSVHRTPHQQRIVYETQPRYLIPLCLCQRFSLTMVHITTCEQEPLQLFHENTPILTGTNL